MKNQKNLIGKRFNLLVVKDWAVQKNGRTQFNCTCDCGNSIVAGSANLLSGNTKSCGCLRVKKAKLPRLKKNKEFLTQKRKAIKENIKFSLTETDFKALIKLKCYYCGTLPESVYNSNEGRYHGIDRRNDASGFEIGNVISCCENCRQAKGDMAFKDFANWILRIVSYNSEELP